MQHKVGNAIEYPVFALLEGGKVRAVALNVATLAPRVEHMMGTVPIEIKRAILTIPDVEER